MNDARSEEKSKAIGDNDRATGGGSQRAVKGLCAKRAGEVLRPPTRDVYRIGDGVHRAAAEEGDDRERELVPCTNDGGDGDSDGAVSANDRDDVCVVSFRAFEAVIELFEGGGGDDFSAESDGFGHSVSFARMSLDMPCAGVDHHREAVLPRSFNHGR